jgi:heptosyltransferase-2
VNTPHLDSVKRILIRSVNWIGDAVMTTPAISVIRERFPNARITILANEMVSELFRHHPGINEIITFHRKCEHRGVAGRIRLASELRKRSFDLAILLPNSFDSALVPWLAGIPQRIGKCSDGRTLLLNGRYHVPQPPPGDHEVQYYLRLLAFFGITGTATPLQLCITQEEEHAATALLAEHGITATDTIIGINPGASYGSAKRWYPERFAEVAARLSDEWATRVVIFGGPGETAIAGEIEQRLNGTALNLAGKTSVRGLMALIKHCNFFVTNDSGPMHIAAAFKVPLVAIFGSTDHTGTSPYNDTSLVIRHDVECAPCKLRECPTDHRCMTGVSAEAVVQGALELANRLHRGAKA